MDPVNGSTTIDVRGLAPSERHAAIFAAYRTVGVGDSFQLVDDHDPQAVYFRLKAEARGNFAWVCAVSGPEVWRVSIQKLARSHGAGECCGVCGSGA
jgi:uncharacterized protein (DUF2249 family)